MTSTPRLAAVVLSVVSVFSFPAHAAGLTAGYGFSEGSGTTTADVSGNGIAGTLVNAPAWVAGKNGTGLSFNGSSTYVDLGNPAALQLTGSMTLSAWVLETANVGDDGQIVAKSDGGAGWQLKSSPDTGVRTFAVRLVSSTGAIVQRYSRTVRSLNTWYYVTGVYDAAARTLNIYVNGALDNGVLNGTVGTSQRNATVNANLGRRTGGFFIRGTIDDVRLYGRALTPTEILDDMNNPVAAPPSDTTPPSTPAGLAALAPPPTHIDLGWAPSTDHGGVPGYDVFPNRARNATTPNTIYSGTG